MAAFSRARAGHLRGCWCLACRLGLACQLGQGGPFPSFARTWHRAGKRGAAFSETCSPAECRGGAFERARGARRRRLADPRGASGVSSRLRLHSGVLPHGARFRMLRVGGMPRFGPLSVLFGSLQLMLRVKRLAYLCNEEAP